MSKKLTVHVRQKDYLQPQRIPVLRDIAFEIEPKHFTCILGPSGCGKTTLLRLAAGLDTNYEGSISLGDDAVRGPRDDSAIVFQEPRLLPWYSVRKNIEFAIRDAHAENRKKDMKALLKLLDLEDFTDTYPHQLSGGMAQRAALARALINLPDLLLLDEPFASLDALTKMKLQSELAHVLQQRKTTTLMVTHDIEEAVFLSDTVLVMSKRPAKIVKAFEINLPHPRQRTSADFEDLHSKVLRFVRHELDLF